MQQGKVRNGGLCSHLVYWFPHECGKRVFDFSHFDGTESAGCFIFTDNPNPMPACVHYFNHVPTWERTHKHAWFESLIKQPTFLRTLLCLRYWSLCFIFGFNDVKEKHRLGNLSLVALYLEIVSADKLAGFGYIYALSNDGIIPMPDRETACVMSDDRPELCNNEHDLLLGLGVLISYI